MQWISILVDYKSEVRIGSTNCARIITNKCNLSKIVAISRTDGTQTIVSPDINIK